MPLTTPGTLRTLSRELSLTTSSVEAVVRLLDDGNTVPFIARYRKEATGGLDEVAIRAIDERRAYLGELEERRATVLAGIESQGELSEDLARRIAAAATKSELEDLYLPYRPKRRTRASMARERGLEGLADRILAQPEGVDPLAEARSYVDADRGVADAEAALAGARDIVAELVSEEGELRRAVRAAMRRDGVIVSSVVPKRKTEKTKFTQYYDFREPVRTIPSHRYLAIRRGEREGVLRVAVEIDEGPILERMHRKFRPRRQSRYAEPLETAIADGLRRLLKPSLESDLAAELKRSSDGAAVEIFASNLENLLLAAPLGGQAVIGIDPGLRTGSKCVAVDATGRFLATTTIYPVRDRGRAERELAAFLERHPSRAIAVGNGTGGRETEALVRGVLGVSGDIFVVSVNEAGASIYSASEIAREEFPELDLTVRGAISIARRLQDPLAELVKLDPKSIGVGQYQHDVDQKLLARKLDEVVESCVNRVGVELNTASAPLLARVAGIGSKLATTIVEHRESKGAFANRRKLQEVAGLGPKTFEQCAGFLRIRESDHPLDRSAVHPERYRLVARMAKEAGVRLERLVGNPDAVRRIDIRRYVSAEVGEPTLADIVAELEKPGRDPRREFEPPAFRDDVQELGDLEEGMELEGVVTNVTAFGAFVDVGVHQDGLVHVSQLADRYVRDPADVVRVGDQLKVRVLAVDLDRKRISLTARKR